MGHPVTWVTFPDAAGFTAWHDTVCGDHGIPHPGRDVDTGALDVFAQWTVAYVEPWDYLGTVVAQVPDDDVATYGLTVTDAPVWLDENGDPVADAPTRVTFDYTLDPGERLKELNDADSD